MRSILEQEIAEITVVHEMKRLYTQEVTAQDEGGEYIDDDEFIHSIEVILYHYMPIVEASTWIERTFKLYRT